MLLEIPNFLSAYILISLIIRIIIQIIPAPIRSAFDIIGELRLKFSQFIISLYNNETNLEVILFAIILAPFSLLVLIFSAIQLAVISNPGLVYVNIWLIIVLVFVISFLAPTPNEVQVLRRVSPLSVFVMIFKILLIVQVVSSFPAFEWVGLLLLILPISPLVRI